jgi:phage terminase Nu1 subunit (DNA packaging protein)
MENAVTRRELIPVSVLTVALARVSSQVAARLDGVPGRLRIRMRDWEQSDFDVIEEEIAAARNLAASVTIEASDLGSGDDTDSDQ